METVITHHASVNGQLLETIASLDAAIFPVPISKDEFAASLRSRHNLCVLIAQHGPEPCGYKIGYEFSPDVFYSFSGGVLPAFRRRGIANALLTEQHRLAKDLGYSIVRTHTKNEYREMLLLNIRAGFDITGVYYKSGERSHSIILEKVLNASITD